MSCFDAQILTALLCMCDGKQTFKASNMKYEISARTPNGNVSHFKNTAEAARAQNQEYLECQYEDVLVYRNGALVSWPDLNYLIAWEFVNFARAKSPGDVGYLA